MPDLVGGIGTFNGDPDVPVWITVESICANCTEEDLDVPPFLRSVVGDACPGIFASKLDALQMSQDAYAQIQQYPATLDPCVWLRYFAPLAFRSDFTVNAPTAEQPQGAWQVSGVWLKISRVRTFANPKYNCYETYERPDSFLWYGAKPTEVSAFSNNQWCFFPGGISAAIADSGYVASVRDGTQYLKPGTLSVVWIGDVSQQQTPSQILQGAVSMPIPEIPDGYPTPPSAPPLTGTAIVDALSDNDCIEIVYRGEGFQKIEDIQDDYMSRTDDEKAAWAYDMDIPNFFNLGNLRNCLLSLNVDFWVTVDLPTTTGGAPLTLQAMINAYEADNDDRRTVWLSNNTRDWLLLDLWDAVAIGDEGTPVWQKMRDILLKVIGEGKMLEPEIEIDMETPVSNWHLVVNTAGEIKLVLHLGRDIAVSDNGIENLLARYCDGIAEMPTAVVVGKNELGATVTDAAYKQLVLDKLDLLTKCCAPCSEYTPNPQVVVQFFGPHTSFGGGSLSESENYTALNRVTFHVLENNMPKIVYFGTPPLQLLAKFSWRDVNGRYGEIQYINLDNTTLIVPNDDIVGFMCHCYDGVALGATIRLRNALNLPSGNAPTSGP